MLRHRVAVVWVSVLALLAPLAMRAQDAEIRGILRDSTSGEPIAGAVVMVLDGRGQMLQRALSGERGQYRVPRPDSAEQLRVLRLGFRAHVVPLRRPFEAITVIDVILSSLERALQPMEVVVARGCPSRGDRAEAFTLLDQARAGVLATVVANERQPARMRVLRYERWLDINGLAVEGQRVQIDSSVRATTSFTAMQSAIDFVEKGFRTGDDGEFTYFGPDAAVLLDDRFQRGYCFSLAEPDSSRATQRGLRFAPAARKRGRVDIEGTLWVDTTQRTLVDIEFRYVGVDRLSAANGAGGRIGFHTLPNGITFIDTWSLRLVGDAARAGAASWSLQPWGLRSSQSFAVSEVGGEVSEAHWDDGTAYRSTLSSAYLTIVNAAGDPASFVRVRFADSDYHATTDANGRATIPFVLPGRYRMLVHEPKFDAIGVEIPVSRLVPIQRAASSVARVVVPSAEQYVASLCGSDTLPPSSAWMLARVVGSSGEPVGGAFYELRDMQRGKWEPISEQRVTASNGVFAHCRSLKRDLLVEVAVWRRGAERVRTRVALDLRLNVLRLVVPTTEPSRATRNGPVVISGLVLDSVLNQPAADVRVTVLGTPFEGATDYSGRFVIGGVPRGDYRIEVSSPWHDSIGAVSRTAVTIRDTTPITLYMPVMRDMVRVACGRLDDVGVIVGRIRTRRGGSLPRGVRVIAEWTRAADDTLGVGRPSTGIAVGAVDDVGTFRICGVPTDQAVTVRVEAEGAETAASPVRTVRVDRARRFVRADFELDGEPPLAAGVRHTTPDAWPRDRPARD